MRTKADMERLRCDFVMRWHRIAERVKAECPDMLPWIGSLAWGRYEGEPTPDERLADIAEGCGYLEGFRSALIRACRATLSAECAKLDRILCQEWRTAP